MPHKPDTRRIRDATNRIEVQEYDYTPRRRDERLPSFLNAWGLCRLSSALNSASGFPSMTPTNTTATISVYRPGLNAVTGETELKVVGVNATIQNYRFVNWVASKTTLVRQVNVNTWAIWSQDA